MPKYFQTICHLHVEQATIPYCLQRSSRRRTIAIMIKDDGVKVYAPKFVSDAKVQEFVLQKSDWILNGVRRMSARLSDSKRSYEEGSEFWFLGDKYPIKFLETDYLRPQITFLEGAWHILIPRTTTDRPSLVRDVLENWYREQAKEFLAGRTLQWARRMSLEVSEINVRTQKRLWGCCYPRQKKIHLNWHIIMAPVEAIDYVIVHELCHLWIPNHSAKFWKKVAEFYPDYPLQKRWFRENSSKLRLGLPT